MSGIMGKRVHRFSKNFTDAYPMAKGFHAPQKDNSKRFRKKTKLGMEDTTKNK